MHALLRRTLRSLERLLGMADDNELPFSLRCLLLFWLTLEWSRWTFTRLLLRSILLSSKVPWKRKSFYYKFVDFLWIFSNFMNFLDFWNFYEFFRNFYEFFMNFYEYLWYFIKFYYILWYFINFCVIYIVLIHFLYYQLK